MLIKRDSDLELQDNFKFSVRSKIEHNHSVDTIQVDGHVFGWVIKEQEPVKVMVVSNGDVDMDSTVKALHGLIGSSLSLISFKLGEETNTIIEALDMHKAQVVFMPNPDLVGSVDDIMSLYLAIKPLGAKLLYVAGGNLFELTGLSPQAARVQ